MKAECHSTPFNTHINPKTKKVYQCLPVHNRANIGLKHNYYGTNAPF